MLDLLSRVFMGLKISVYKILIKLYENEFSDLVTTYRGNTLYITWYNTARLFLLSPFRLASLPLLIPFPPFHLPPFHLFPFLLPCVLLLLPHVLSYPVTSIPYYQNSKFRLKFSPHILFPTFLKKLKCHQHVTNHSFPTLNTGSFPKEPRHSQLPSALSEIACSFAGFMVCGDVIAA